MATKGDAATNRRHMSTSTASASRGDGGVGASPGGLTGAMTVLPADLNAGAAGGFVPRLIPVSDDAPATTRSGIPAPFGIGAWGGRRLRYRGDPTLEAMTNRDLHVVLLDLLVRVARSRADLEGRCPDRRKEVRRAAKVSAMAAAKAAVVAATAGAVTRAISALANAIPPVEVSFSSVADRLALDGVGVHRSTLYRRPEYANPILAAMGLPPLDDASACAAADPEYARVARLTKAELVEEIRRGRRALKEAEKALADHLSTL